MAKPEEKMVFAISELDGQPLIVLGIPEAAWEFMKDGKTHHFDLSKVGIPVKVMVFGGKDQAECLKVITDANAARGIATLSEPGKDYGIDKAKPD